MPEQVTLRSRVPKPHAVLHALQRSTIQMQPELLWQCCCVGGPELHLMESASFKLQVVVRS
jgi:hypothetical protein